MGVKSVHPLDGIDQEQSIKSTKSILSIPIAPALHQEIPPTNWIGGSINMLVLYCTSEKDFLLNHFL
jgi:hypothetical protein